MSDATESLRKAHDEAHAAIKRLQKLIQKAVKPFAMAKEVQDGR